MASVGITELKAHLGEYLRRVEAGETLYVTFRGREVAELRPADPVRAAIWKMVANGEAEWNGEKPTLPDDPPINTGRLLSDIVLEDRGPHWDEPDEPSRVILYLDTSALVKLLLVEAGALTTSGAGSRGADLVTASVVDVPRGLRRSGSSCHRRDAELVGR